MSGSLTPNMHKPFLELLIAGNHAECSALIQDFVNNRITITELYENIIKKALYDIGEMWEYNKISVATEHLASSIVEALLNQLYDKVISENKIGKIAIIACTENELHQIGIKMVGDVFEMNGWDVYFLGANTSTSELLAFAKTMKPDILAISISIYFHLPVFESMVKTIREEFPDLIIIVGGQAFLHGGQEILSKYKHVIYKPDLESIDFFIKNLNQKQHGQKLIIG